MLTIDAHTEVDQTPPATPRRKPSRRIARIAAATLVVAGVAGVAVVRNADSSPVPRSQDDAVRELVEEGFVPAATLSDGTHVTGSRVATRSHDHYVGELVDRGLVPAATLSDGTPITGSSKP
jgi:ferric-dicitrate binding protein FerR (iron transport regulator)